MATKKAAIYVRVSTNDQETDRQETELREYVEARRWDCVLYRDKGQSGAKSDRPALKSMMADLRRRKFDVVVVWGLDRLARSLKQLLSSLGLGHPGFHSLPEQLSFKLSHGPQHLKRQPAGGQSGIHILFQRDQVHVQRPAFFGNGQENMLDDRRGESFTPETLKE